MLFLRAALYLRAVTRLSRTLFAFAMSLGLWAAADCARAVSGEEKEALEMADQLRRRPQKAYEFNRAVLRDVLRFLADDAGISFVSVPEVGQTEEKLVTFTLRASPFRALEIIAKANGVALFYEEGVWYLRPYNDKELIARIYKIKYNTQEEVTSSDSAATSAPQATTSGEGGTAGGSVPDLALSLQGVTEVFKTNPKQLVADIKSLLGIPTSGFEAANAGEVSVDERTTLGIPPQSVVPGSADEAADNVAGKPGGPQVIWNSDSNTLYVVASRQQQQWVEGYLQSMDRPQPLIAIEVKFLETNKDPKKQLGVDWAGTLGDGFTLAARQITASPNGSINVLKTDARANSSSSQRDAESGQYPPQSTPTGPFDILSTQVLSTSNSDSSTVKSFAAPYSAVLSAGDVAVTLRAFMEDRDSSQVSYPRVLTRNNREVVIRSVINQPVLASTSSVTPGVGGTTTASVSYLPIGTIINVLPKQMDDGSIALNISISISNILRQDTIAGNLYPVASTRVFTAALSVTSGYTLAIGGLEEAKDEKQRNGVPFLKDIPLLGEAFKSKSRSQVKTNLIIFITPTLLPSKGTRGIAKEPESTIPVSPGEPEPPSFTIDGMLVGGRDSLANAVRWVVRRYKYYAEIVKESRTQEKTIEEIEGLMSVCLLLTNQVDLMQTALPEEPRYYESLAEQIDETLYSLQTLKDKAKKSLLDF
jgi:type II secretory pathway component GspD/PulD (secretin)